MTIVAAYAMSHVSYLARSDIPEELSRAFARVGDQIREIAPDAVLMVCSDHYEMFSVDNFPAFCLGIGEEHKTAGDAGQPTQTLVGDNRLAMDLLAGLVARDFDVSFSEHMQVDHGVLTPLMLMGLAGASCPPVIPLFQNCTTKPMPSLRRCAALGLALRQVVENLKSPARVVIIGTGGLSHWVGLDRMGDVSEAFDQQILQFLARGDIESVLSMSDEEIEREGGNGAYELRNWVTAWACGGSRPVDVFSYFPLQEAITGVAVAKLG